MTLPMHLNNLGKIINSDGPFEWIDPELIEGIDPYTLKISNERKWFRKNNISDDIETEDEIIVDYLCECLLERKMDIENRRSIPHALDIDAVMLVKAGIFLICDLGSSYAGTNLAVWRDLITDRNARKCLDLLCSAYERSDPFVRDILRDFILNLFRFGPLWDPPEGTFSTVLTNEQNKFLTLIFEKGYSTINNQDARFFSDGSKRI